MLPQKLIKNYSTSYLPIGHQPVASHKSVPSRHFLLNQKEKAHPSSKPGSPLAAFNSNDTGDSGLVLWS